MKVGKFKKILSHIFPVLVETCSTKHNNYLEVVYSKGLYLLNSEKTNYSFGGLHVIFKKTFNDIEINKFNISNCLLLGLGGGSIIHILKKNYRMSIPITTVEIDPRVIYLAHKYFNLSDYNKLFVVNDDAFTYVKNSTTTFDLIIIDVYKNDQVPKIFRSKEFVLSLQNVAHPNSIILFNQMISAENSDQECNELIQEIKNIFKSVDVLSYTINEIENRLICVNVNRVEQNEETENPYLQGSLFNPG